MKKTAIILMFITVLTKVIGFARDIILAYFFGATGNSDAYLISITIPGTLFAFFSTSISTSFIPIYSKILIDRGLDAANKYTNNLMNIVLIASSLLIAIVFFYTEPIVKIFALGFNDQTLKVAATLTKISVLSIYFTGIIAILSGYLQIKGKFVIPTVALFPFSLVSIIFIIISAKLENVYLLAIGYVLGTLAQLVLIIFFSCKNELKYKFIVDLKNEHIRKMAIMVFPIMLGISVNQVNVLVDRTIASTLVVGGISALNYAQKLNGFIQSIFVLSIVTILYPTISKMIAENNINGFKKMLSESINIINLFVVPASIGTMVFSKEIITLLFGRGAFDINAIRVTTEALFFYSIGMISIGLREVLVRAFYSLHDTKTPTINATLGVVLNIILNVILSRTIGIGGLALATSLSAFVTTTLLFILLRKKIGSLNLKKTITTSAKITIASLIMGLIAKVTFNFYTSFASNNVALMISIAAGAVSYFLMIYILKVEAIHNAVNIAKRTTTKVA